MVIVKDSRKFYGVLEGVDDKNNIVLKNAIEEIPVPNISEANLRADHPIQK